MYDAETPKCKEKKIPRLSVIIKLGLLKRIYSMHVDKEELEDTKGLIRICISKKNRQHNDQKKKYKRTNNKLQNIHIKLKIE